MNKQTMLTALLVGAMMGTTILGCKKDGMVSAGDAKPTQNQESKSNSVDGVSTDGQMLSFASIGDYEKVISSRENESGSKVMKAIERLNFERYSTTNIAKSEGGEQMDETLGGLLNKDGAIQIGQYIYKVDVQKDSVFAIDAKYKDVAYQDLIVGNTQHKSVVGFSTDEEVLYLVDDRMSKSGEDKKRKWFCREDGAGGRYNQTELYYLSDTENCAAWADYSRFGIYFKLKFGVETNLYPYQTRYHVYVQFDNLWYKIKCETQPMGPISNPWWNNHKNNVNAYGGYHIEYASYQGSRPLNGYHVRVRARVEDWGKSNGSLPYTTHFSDWAKINVNSPWW